MKSRAFDGKWQAFDRVRLSLDDRAVLYGYTVFETLRMEQGVALFWREHRKRLVRSLRLLRFPDSARVLREVDAAVVSAPRFEQGVLRVTISRGEGRGLARPALPHVYASLHEIGPQEAPGRAKLALVDAPRMIGLFAAKHGKTTRSRARRWRRCRAAVMTCCFALATNVFTRAALVTSPSSRGAPSSPRPLTERSSKARRAISCFRSARSSASP